MESSPKHKHDTLIIVIYFWGYYAMLHFLLSLANVSVSITLSISGQTSRLYDYVRRSDTVLRAPDPLRGRYFRTPKINYRNTFGP